MGRFDVTRDATGVVTDATPSTRADIVYPVSIDPDRVVPDVGRAKAFSGHPDDSCWPLIAAVAAGPWPDHQPDLPSLVKGRPAPGKPRPVDPATARSAPQPAAGKWPAAGTATVPTAAPAVAGAARTTASKAVRAGNPPVLVGPPTARTAAAWAASAATTPLPQPAAVRVRHPDRKAAAKRGADGLLPRARRDGGEAAAGPAGLSVDHSAFRNAAGSHKPASLSPSGTCPVDTVEAQETGDERRVTDNLWRRVLEVATVDGTRYFPAGDFWGPEIRTGAAPGQ